MSDSYRIQERLARMRADGEAAEKQTEAWRTEQDAYRRYYVAPEDSAKDREKELMDRAYQVRMGAGGPDIGDPFGELSALRQEQTRKNNARFEAGRQNTLAKYQGMSDLDPSAGMSVKIPISLDGDKMDAQSVVKALQAGDLAAKDRAPLTAYMSKEEKDTLLGLAGTGDWDHAGEYYKALKRDLNARKTAKETEELGQLAKRAPILGAAINMEADLFQGGAYLANAGQMVKNAVTGEYEPTDYNSGWFGPANTAAATAKGVAQAGEEAGAKLGEKVGGEKGAEVGGKVGSFVSQGALSVGNMLTKMPLGPVGSMAAIYGSAAGGNTLDALQRGASPEEAAMTSTAAGAAEVLTEKLPFDEWLRLAKTAPKSAREVLLNTLKSMASEGAQEMVTEVANNAVDQAVMGDRSSYDQYVRELMDQGVGEEKAKKQATKQFWLDNVLSAGAGGAFSGGLMAGTTQLYGYATNRKAGASGAEPVADPTAAPAAGDEAARAENVPQPGTAEKAYTDAREAETGPVMMPTAQRETQVEPVMMPTAQPEAEVKPVILPVTGEEAQNGQKKAASVGETETGLVPITEQKAASLSSGKNNIIARKASDIVSFVRKALGKKGGPERLYMGTIPDSAASTIKAATGMDVTGYTAILPGDSVQHIFKRHGDVLTEDARGQKAVTAEDIALIPQVIASPDNVSLSGESDALGRPVLLISKQIGDTYVTAQAVTDGRHALTTNSLWIKKGKNTTPIPDAGISAGPEGNAQGAPVRSSSTYTSIASAAMDVKGGAESGDPVMMPTAQPEAEAKPVMLPVAGEETQNGQKKTASEVEAGNKPKMSMADFTDRESPVWNNVRYEDTETQSQIQSTVHQEMVNAGEVVHIPEETLQKVSESYPDLRTMKKSERTPILRQKMNELKTSLRQFLNGLKGGSYEFEVNGNILEARLYDTGVREVMEKITQDKASVLFQSEEIFQNARYLYSTPDYDGDPNVYRWNYFYTPVQIGDQTVGVRIAVRDMVKQQESQIYNWGIKTGAALDGERGGITRSSLDVSSAAPVDVALDGGRPGTIPNTTGVSSAAPAESDSTPIVHQTTDGVNGGAASVSPDDSTGAAPMGFDPYSHLKNQTDSFHPDGEKAYRQVDVPRKDANGRNIPKSTATVMEAQATPDSAVGVIQSAIADGTFSFDTNTDKGAISRGEAMIRDKGYDGAREVFHQAAQSGYLSKDMVALGQLLLNSAMNSKDDAATVSLMHDYATMSTTAAQSLQAQRILKKLSPEWQLYSVQKSVENYQNALIKEMGDKAPDIKVPDELYQNYVAAADEASREAALVEIYKNVAAQVPATWKDKWNAWRYLAMLGNPRTHGRNIAGNAGFVPVRMVKDAIATGIEAGADYLSPQGIKRTKAALNPASEADRALVKAAFGDIANVEAQLLGEGKYNDSARGRIEEYRQIFKLKPLEDLRTFNSNAMDVEDTWFSKPAYAGALAGYLKANGVTAETMNAGSVDAKLLDAARSYAIHEAQKATYRDSNEFSDFVSKLRVKEKGRFTSAASAVWEGILPFRKTPANILMRGIEYSPIGLAKGLTSDLSKVFHGKMEAAQAIDNIAAGLTGTGILALGMFLASKGLVTGGQDEEDAQRRLDSLTGTQYYALSIGGKNFTIDWLAPEAMPFFVGVELYKSLSDEMEGGVTWKNLQTSIYKITDPMLQMSMLSGLQDAIDNVRYAETGTIPTIIANAALSYLTQGIPTLFGQAERTGESQRYETFVDRTSGVPRDVQYALGRVMNKLPGEFQQIPYIDAWGRTEETGNVAERAFNNFLNPSYTSEEVETAADVEIQRLLDAGQKGVVPRRPSQGTEITWREPGDTEDRKRYMTAEEYVEYATIKGQTSLEIVTAMIGSDYYAAMNNDEKADAIQKAYEYAGSLAAEAITEGKHVSAAYVELAQQAKKELGLSETEYLLLYTKYGGGVLNSDGIRSAYDAGISPEEYGEYKLDTYALGKNKKKADVVKVIDSQDLSAKEKDELYLLEGYAKSELWKTPWQTWYR